MVNSSFPLQNRALIFKIRWVNEALKHFFCFCNVNCSNFFDRCFRCNNSLAKRWKGIILEGGNDSCNWQEEEERYHFLWLYHLPKSSVYTFFYILKKGQWFILNMLHIRVVLGASLNLRIKKKKPKQTKNKNKFNFFLFRCGKPMFVLGLSTFIKLNWCKLMFNSDLTIISTLWV